MDGRAGSGGRRREGSGGRRLVQEELHKSEREKTNTKTESQSRRMRSEQ